MVPGALIEQGAIVILAPGARVDEPKETAKAAAKAPAKKVQKAAVKQVDTAKSAKKAAVVSTGWPAARIASGRVRSPGPNARVAPFRCTKSRVFTPSISCTSSLHVLWGTS